MREICFLFLLTSAAPAQNFFPDDPLDWEPRPVNVEKAAYRKLSEYYDLFLHQFGHPGERQPKNGPPIRAKGVSTLGEPMQGAWWVKRHYYHPMSIEELVKGTGGTTPPAMDRKWTVVSVKNEGVTPGFVIIDGNKRRYFVKFDPLTNPEMATAADSITSRFFYAMGYHVPDNYIVYFTEDQLVLGEDTQVSSVTGKKTRMTRRDLLEILLKVPLTRDGRYRATASLAIAGKPLGPPRYFGTRSDDPNDIVPHEHRRDLRGLAVIDAWLDHDDSRAINNFDALVKDRGVQYIRHYELDFGSTLGSGTEKPNSPRSGAYHFSWKESAAELFSLGLYIPYWAKARYPDYPSIGRFEWKVFDPEKWVPEYPNPAFLNRLPDDEFWGAKLVTAFTDDEIRAIVGTGELSDKEAEAYLLQCLIERRNKIGKTYFAKVLPFDQFRLDDGRLRWVDLGAKLGYYPRAQVDIQWSRFDNGRQTKSPLEDAKTVAVPEGGNGYWCATITSQAKRSQTIDVYVHRTGAQMKIAGIERTW
ncbi:MAG: hypothetical protein IT167_12160 [Bryobacterales bacterium]|nr:hypothetical protein [Bryobacterales bacterium]